VLPLSELLLSDLPPGREELKALKILFVSSLPQ
jgi:hypothetical protein